MTGLGWRWVKERQVKAAKGIRGDRFRMAAALGFGEFRILEVCRRTPLEGSCESCEKQQWREGASDRVLSCGR
jgi:hypothetical protein